MTDREERKTGPGPGVWMALTILGMLLVVAIAGSKKVPISPESISQEVKTLAVAPSVEAELPAREPLSEISEAPASHSATAKLETPIVTPIEKTVLRANENIARTLKLGMPVIEAEDDEKVLPLDYTCYRANKSPPLQWTGAPAKTKSFAVSLERLQKDKSPEIRWMVFNIPASAKGLSANLPKQAEVFKDGTAQARNDQGYAQYVGPCDAQGKVEYVFRLFALDQVLKVLPGAPKNDLIKEMNGHIIDEAVLRVVHYFRIK